MNNIIFAAHKPNPLVRVWRSTGRPGGPLVCNWVHAETAKLRFNSVADETGGISRCA